MGGPLLAVFGGEGFFVCFGSVVTGSFGMSDPRVVLSVVSGDLLAQSDVDCWVNPWNRNFVPRLLLVPVGVSGALKRVTGSEPWKHLARFGVLRTGDAVLTSGGWVPQSLIHVAGLNGFWVATESSIRLSVRNAVRLAWREGFGSVAVPLIGAGTGGKSQDEVLGFMQDEVSGWVVPSSAVGHVLQVRFVVFPDGK